MTATQLRALLARLATELSDLRRLAAADRQQLLADTDRLKSVKYSFVVAIEVCVDIASHLIAARQLRAPATYADGFVSLAEAGLIDQAFAAPLGDMAGFRNLLVHGYARVDDGRVVEILHTRLDDLDRFAQEIAREFTEPGSSG